MVSFMDIIQNSLVHAKTTYSVQCSTNKTSTIVKRGSFMIDQQNFLGVVATAGFVEMFLKDDPNY